MSLVDVEVLLGTDRLPLDVRSFIRRSQRRIEDFTEATRSSPLPAFVPSDFETAYRVLHAILDQNLVTGSVFCEWGSGFGVVTCLAAMLEFDAYGIECEPELVDEATRLAEDFDLPAEFVVGTFLPAEVGDLAVTPGELSWLTEGGADAYDALGLEIADFDVVYVYPWPDESATIDAVFDRFAADGGLLLTFDGRDSVRIRRKVIGRRQRFR